MFVLSDEVLLNSLPNCKPYNEKNKNKKLKIIKEEEIEWEKWITYNESRRWEAIIG